MQLRNQCNRMITAQLMHSYKQCYAHMFIRNVLIHKPSNQLHAIPLVVAMTMIAKTMIAKTMIVMTKSDDCDCER